MSTTSALSTIHGIPVKHTDDGPRVPHVEVAKLLGYPRADAFTKLVEAHAEKLSEFGVLALEAKTSTIKGGRPTSIYLLNQKQVLFLCAKSDQPIAFEVTSQMVRLFDEALRTGGVGRAKAWIERLLSPAKADWNIMFETPLVKALCCLDGYIYDTGRQPAYLKSTYAKIYSTILGSAAWEEMGRRANDPEFLYARKHQQFRTDGPREAFRNQLEIVTVLANQSRSKSDFWARMDRQYGSGLLQLELGTAAE
jgi:hypothetical protein